MKFLNFPSNVCLNSGPKKCYERKSEQQKSDPTLAISGVWRPSVIVSVTTKTSIWVGDCGRIQLEVLNEQRGEPYTFSPLPDRPVGSQVEPRGLERNGETRETETLDDSFPFSTVSNICRELRLVRIVSELSLRQRRHGWLNSRTEESIGVNWWNPWAVRCLERDIKRYNIRRLIKKHRAVYIQSSGATKYWNCGVLNFRVGKRLDTNTHRDQRSDWDQTISLG